MKVKTIFDLSADEALDFLMQNDRYVTTEMPEYLNFDPVLAFAREHIADTSIDKCLKDINPENHFAGFLIVNAVKLTFLEPFGNDLFFGCHVQVELILVESVIDFRQKDICQCVRKRRRSTRISVIVAKCADEFRNLRVLDLVNITSTINQA